MSPRSAYPEGYKLGPDNQGRIMGFKNMVQVWFTGGPRVPSGFWKWREMPAVLYSCRGDGPYRIENSEGTEIDINMSRNLRGVRLDGLHPPYYLSRIQPWVRYHFALMWPLGIHWSVIWFKKDVVQHFKYQSNFGIEKMFAGYLGWIRDSDRFYKPKIYAGGNFE